MMTFFVDTCEIPKMNHEQEFTLYVRLIHLYVHKSAHTRILLHFVPSRRSLRTSKLNSKVLRPANIDSELETKTDPSIQVYTRHSSHQAISSILCLVLTRHQPSPRPESAAAAAAVPPPSSQPSCPSAPLYSRCSSCRNCTR